MSNKYLKLDKGQWTGLLIHGGIMVVTLVVVLRLMFGMKQRNERASRRWKGTLRRPEALRKEEGLNKDDPIHANIQNI